MLEGDHEPSTFAGEICRIVVGLTLQHCLVLAYCEGSNLIAFAHWNETPSVQ